jgi:hypothetical protein|tara:strand:- start:2298 stop:2810 length:513 start_codon:yes stop_codon:yes gene_type:complete
MLKGVGLKSVFMSIKCVDQLYCNYILERKISDDQLFNSFEIFRKYKINILPNSFLALPETLCDNGLNAFGINIQCKPTCALVCIFQPYPKLKLTSYSIENRHLNADEENQNIPFTFFGKLVLISPFSILSSILTSYCYQRKIYPHNLTLKRLWYNMKAALFYFTKTFKAS